MKVEVLRTTPVDPLMLPPGHAPVKSPLAPGQRVDLPDDYARMLIRMKKAQPALASVSSAKGSPRSPSGEKAGD